MNDASRLRDQIEECVLREVGRDDLKGSFPLRMKPCGRCRTELYEFKQVDSESRDSDGMSHEMGVVSGAQTSDCLSHECFLVRIMSATFVDAGIRVVGERAVGYPCPA
jgi:hypothetical protein